MSKELEALNRLISFDKECNCISQAVKDDFALIEKALKRNEPMKPLKVNNTKLIYWCSKCDCSSIQRYDKFCHECGQALDWSDEK